MREPQPSRLSPLERQPVEIVCQILSAMPDLQTLKAALLSCPAFYYRFRGFEGSTVMEILGRQIESSVLPEAIIAKDASQRDNTRYPMKFEDAEKFTDRCLKRRPSAADFQRLNLAQALRVEELVYCVDYFSNCFIINALNACQDSEKATDAERCRVKRAFFRFELYCNLMPDLLYNGERDDPFFKRFSPWENEQLGCVHDYLARAVMPVLVDTAGYEIKDSWLAHEVERCCEMDSPQIQYILSLGLRTIYRLSIAKSYDERYKLLADAPVSPAMSYSFNDYSVDSTSANRPPLHKCDEFLHWALKFLALEFKESVFVADLSADELNKHISPSFFLDQDTGPSRIWRWAYCGANSEETLASFFFRENRQDLRDWAFVMWDESRLDKLRICENLWEEPTPMSEKEKNVYRKAQMKIAWGIIHDLHNNASTGQWLWEDKREQVLRFMMSGKS